MIRLLAIWGCVLLCLSLSGCRDTSVPARSWVGRWEDGTGYWLEISETNGGFVLRRSPGSLWHLAFLEQSANGKRIRYREDNDYIHTLRLISTNKIEDEWLQLSNSNVWQTIILHKTQVNAIWGTKE